MITDIKEIAKLVRADIAKAIKKGTLPAIKVSVRLQRFSGGCSLSVYVTEVPEGFVVVNAEHVRWSALNPHLCASFHAPESARCTHSQEALAVEETLKAIVGAYNWDRSDRMTDYFDVNFYEHVGFDWRLEATHRKAVRASEQAQSA